MNPDSPAFIEQEILRLSRELEDATHDMAGYAHASAKADSDYKKRRAQEVLRAHHEAKDRKLTVAVIDALADEATEVEYFAKRAAEANLSACQEKTRNLRTQIEGLRTLAANQRFLLERAS